MSTNSFFAKALRFIGIVLMALTGGFTLLGGIGTTCAALFPTNYDSMAALAPFQWLYILFVIAGIVLGVWGIWATVKLVRGTSDAYIMSIRVLIAGVLVVGSVLTFDKLKIDDPVGAISVHLTCGIWGTLAVGIFSTNPEHSLLIQAYGVLCYGVFTVVCAAAIFLTLKATVGLRVSEEEELEGLDLGEHGMHAYDLAGSPGFMEEPRGAFAEAGLASRKLATSES